MLFPALETCGVLMWCLDRTGHGRDILRRPCVYGLVAFGLDDYSAYIGSTKHFSRRLREHVWDARMALRGTLPSAVTHRMLEDPVRAPGVLLAVALQTDGLEKPDARHDAELVWMLAANQNGVRPVNKGFLLKNRRRPGWPGEPRLGDLIKRSEQVVWPTTWLEVLRRGLAAAETHGADVVTPDLVRLPPTSRTHKTLPDEPANRRQ